MRAAEWWGLEMARERLAEAALASGQNHSWAQGKDARAQSQWLGKIVLEQICRDWVKGLVPREDGDGRHGPAGDVC